MIPTQPSDRIEDFISFVAALYGPEVVARRVGASQTDVDRYESLCRYALPKLLRDYLLEFGESDGGADLGFGAMPHIRRLIEYYEHVNRHLAESPWDFDRSLIFVVDEHGFDRSLLPSGGRLDVDSNVAHTDGGEYSHKCAASLANYLYSSVIASARFPNTEPTNFLIFGFPEEAAFPALVEGVQAIGCQPYWFSDAFQACLENGPDTLHFVSTRCGPAAYIDCIDRTRRLEYRALLKETLGAVYVEDGDFRWMAPRPAIQ